MPLEKFASSKADHVRVSFCVPAEAQAGSVDVVGEFTDWGVVPMQRNDDGSYETVFHLQVGRTYRFRYLVDGKSWENDWAADNYVPNGYGGDDSVVDVRSSSRLGDAFLNGTEPVAVLSRAAQGRRNITTPAVEGVAS